MDGQLSARAQAEVDSQPASTVLDDDERKHHFVQTPSASVGARGSQPARFRLAETENRRALLPAKARLRGRRDRSGSTRQPIPALASDREILNTLLLLFVSRDACSRNPPSREVCQEARQG